MKSIARIAPRLLQRMSSSLSSSTFRALPVRSFRTTSILRDDQFADEWVHDREVLQVSKPAPRFHGTAVVNGEFKEIASEDYAGKWLVLFFYPLDFTFVCPTEIRAFSERFAEFEKLGCAVVGCSVDSKFSHLAWIKQDPKIGGLGPMNIPILADITKTISHKYGVLLEDEGIALRGLFIIDPNGVLRQSTVNDLPIGRSVDETLRLVQALQFNAKHGEVCPAGWKPGQQAMKATEAGLKEYFKNK